MYETKNSEVNQARQKEKQAIIDELKKLKYADNSYEARKWDYQLRRKLEDLS